MVFRSSSTSDVEARESSPATARTRRFSDRSVGLLVGVGAFGLYLLCQRSAIPSYDGKIMLAVAKSMAHGTLSIGPTDDVYGRNTPYSHYGIGVSLFALPFFVIEQAWHLPRSSAVTLTNPALLSMTAWVLFAIGRRLGWSRGLSLVAPFVFVVGGMTAWASTELFSEPGICLAVSLLVLGLIGWSRAERSGPLIAGLAFGLGLLFRTDTVVTMGLALVALPLLVPFGRLLRGWRDLVAFSLPVVASLAWIAFYAEKRDHQLMPAVYGGRFSSRGWPHGLWGLTVSHGVGIVWYAPCLLVGIPGLYVLWRKNTGLAAVLLLLVVTRPVVFAGWSDWKGGVSWGPRFLLPCAVPLCLLVASAVSATVPWRSPVRWLARGLVGALVAVSAWISVASVAVPYEAAWRHTMVIPMGTAPSDRAVVAIQNATRYEHSFAASPLGFDLDHAFVPSPYFPLRHWRGGVSPIGMLGILLAVAGWGGAVALSRRDVGQEAQSDVDLVVSPVAES